MSDDDPRDDAFVYEIDTELPSEAVVEAVAAATDRDPVPSTAADDPDGALDPLRTAIDPDALDELFGRERYSSTVDYVRFPYHGYEVIVHSRGVVRMVEFEDGAER